MAPFDTPANTLKRALRKLQPSGAWKATLTVALLALTLAAPPAVHSDEAGAQAGRASYRAGLRLLEESRWQEAADKLAEAVAADPLDGEAHYQLGVASLKLGDVVQADAHLGDAVNLEPALAPEAAALWRAEGDRVLDGGEVLSGLGYYTKAVALDQGLGEELGLRILKASATMPDDVERARAVARVTKWVGADAAMESTMKRYRKRLGPPTGVELAGDGWAPLPPVRLNDSLHYLSTREFREKDEVKIRIMPPSIEMPTVLHFGEEDMGGHETTTLQISKHQEPTKVYIWIMPAP